MCSPCFSRTHAEPAPPRVFRVWPWCVCECVYSARSGAYVHLEIRGEDGKCGFKILHAASLSWAYGVQGAPSPACVYKTPEPQRTRPKLRRYGGDEKRESLQGVPLGRPAGALSQILKVRDSRPRRGKGTAEGGSFHWCECRSSSAAFPGGVSNPCALVWPGSPGQPALDSCLQV